MHLIIAGAARAGKTTLSMKLKERYVHYKMDSIKRGICKAYNLKYDDWEELSPIMCTIINQIIEDNNTDTNALEENYLFDTPFIYPKDIKLINTQNTLVMFLGYSKLTPQENFINIRNNDKENIWTNRVDDSQLIKMCYENVKFSKYLKKECKVNGIKYFDTSYNREEVLEQIIKYIEIQEKKSSGYCKKMKSTI